MAMHFTHNISKGICPCPMCAHNIWRRAVKSYKTRVRDRKGLRGLILPPWPRQTKRMDVHGPNFYPTYVLSHRLTYECQIWKREGFYGCCPPMHSTLLSGSCFVGAGDMRSHECHSSLIIFTSALTVCQNDYRCECNWPPSTAFESSRMVRSWFVKKTGRNCTELKPELHYIAPRLRKTDRRLSDRLNLFIT